ncbi:parallel beta-helix repeat protein [Azospirillum agricola]|uniref:right-handed parallel beta-helix repeat-containing protein n=1 Tax=Azospirillum agricola TaxID=1720247 RepID=UPI001AEA6609|nr:right-handed parallel beta-helix repeat-containing protein [Azospirillum agricola]MBP2230261.1 parallel beta-helix repeat protein [Azospirillum agricola]
MTHRMAPRMARRTILALVAFLSLTAPLRAEDAESIVSPQGNDQWSGRLADPAPDGRDGPFATPARALEEARRGGPNTIRLRAGTYALTEPLVVGGNLSGLRIAAYLKETPVLSGGERIGGASVDDKGVLSAPLARDPGLDVALAGVRLDAARSGDFDPADPVRSGWFPAKASKDDPKSPGSKRKLLVPPGTLRAGWAGPGVRAQALDRERLSDDLLGVASTDPRGLLTLDRDGQYPYRDGSTVRLLGHPDFLKHPGQFAWDAKAKRLMVLPPKERADGRGELVVARLGALIRVEGARDVAIEGLGFADVPQDGTAILLKGGGGHRVAGNRFALVGTAVTLDGTGGSEIAGNRMDHLGRSGVQLMPGSDGNRILGNRMANIGEVRFFGGGVMAAGVRNTLIAHNDIRHAARYGISIKNWNEQTKNVDNVVEYNRIRDTARQTADAGAIETLGRSDIDTRTVIRFNDIRDTGGIATDAAGQWLTRYKGFGIYLDDLTDGVTVEGNLLENTGMAAIFLHGGDGNRVTNNVALLTDPKDRFLRLEWVPSAGKAGFMRDNVATGNIVQGVHGPAAKDQLVNSLSGGEYRIEGTVTGQVGEPLRGAAIPRDRIGPEGMR